MSGARIPHPFIRPPVWLCETCGHKVASPDRVAICPACESCYVDMLAKQRSNAPGRVLKCEVSDELR